MNGITSLLWFCAILALIPATLWLLKRTPIGGAGTGGLMKSVASLPLSTSQRIVTVEVGSGEERRWLVLGITPSSITTLHTMEPQAVDTASVAATRPATGAVPPAFAAVLARLRGERKGDGDAR